ncbi:MAG: hypothetical protein WC009_11130 [Methylotenera sp.]
MQVEAIYNQGKIELSQPLRLKHNHVRLVITVPDDEIEVQDNAYNLSPEMLASAEAMLDKLEAVRNAPLSAGDELKLLSAKQLERIEAFELRAEMRKEQGRPV